MKKYERKLNVQQMLNRHILNKDVLTTSVLIEMYEDTLLQILQPLANDEYYDTETNKFGSKQMREAVEEIIELFDMHTHTIQYPNKLLAYGTYCGKPHNNGDDTCLECEAIKKGV